MTRRRIVLSCGIAGALASMVASAQPGFPSRPIKLVVAAPPGGSSDLVARTLASGLSVALGKPVIVENRPGASGAIAAESAAPAAHDGHTLMLSWIGNATGQALLRTRLHAHYADRLCIERARSRHLGQIGDCHLRMTAVVVPDFLCGVREGHESVVAIQPHTRHQANVGAANAAQPPVVPTVDHRP